MNAATPYFVPWVIAALLSTPLLGCAGGRGPDNTTPASGASENTATSHAGEPGMNEPGTHDMGQTGAHDTTGPAGNAPPGQSPAASQAREATAAIESRSGSKVTGNATFTADGNNVTLKIDLHGLPAGVHAVHIHEKGDCSSSDAESAGGHWNPTSEAHGKWGTAPFHLGDIGNVTVAADGNGTITLTTDKWSIGTGERNDVVGHAIVVHSKQDDLKSQPAGAAGSRIGCGVISRK